MEPEEFGAMSANIKSLCDRVTYQSAQIEKLSSELRALGEQVLVGQSALKGFKMGVASALILLGGSAGAGIWSWIDKVWK